MLPVVKLERLEVFSCDECPFVSHDKLVTQYHQVVSHLKDFKQEVQQLGYESDNARNEDQDVLASDKSSGRRPNKMLVKKKRGRPPKAVAKANMFECVFCDQTFQSKDPLKEHLLQVHVQGIQPVAVPSSIQCCICALRFDNTVLMLHLRMVHSLSSKEAKDIVDVQLGQVEPEPEEQLTDKPFEALKIPDKTDSFNESLDENFSDDAGNDAPFDEDFFPEVGGDPEDEEHVSVNEGSVSDPDPASGSAKSPSKRMKQKKSQTWDSCLLCKVPFEGVVPDLEGHYKSLHKSSTECFLCSKAFTRTHSVRRHLSVSHGLQFRKHRLLAEPLTKGRKRGRRTKCPECDRLFDGVISLAKHLKKRHQVDQLGIAKLYHLMIAF